MNYDKQKPLSQEELNRLNSLSLFFKIGQLKNYPKDNVHLEVKWSLPINITRNEDATWLSSEECNKENYWVVHKNLDKAEPDFELKAKQFKKLEEAVEYALKGYNAWLMSRRTKTFELFKVVAAIANKPFVITEQKLTDPFLDEERILDRLRRELQKYGKLIIAYDYDYTINNYRNEPWEFPELIKLLQDWKDYAHFICYSVSAESRYPEIRAKAKKLNVPLDYINKNIDGLTVAETGKLYYSVLLDDRAGLPSTVRVLRRLIDEVKANEKGSVYFGT